MERRGDKESQPNAGDQGAHRALCENGIRDHSGQGPIITNRSGHDNRDALADTGCHDSLLDHSRRDRRFNTANGSNPVDGPQMMLMPMPHRASGGEPIPEGGAIEIGFHVMGSQGVSAEEDVDKSLFDEPRECLSSPGMDNRRSAGEQDV